MKLVIPGGSGQVDDSVAALRLATRWMLELAALALRAESELVLKSRRVVPERLLEAGFAFACPEWPAAARDLVARFRAGAS